MKKTMKLITLIPASVLMTSMMLAIEFIDQAAADAYDERQRQKSQLINENMERGKADDAALKDAICSLFEMIFFVSGDVQVTYVSVMEDMHRHGIPRERQIQGLENMVREMLSAVEKGEKIDDPYWVQEFSAMLMTFPNYDILPLLKECLNSKNEIIRNGAMKHHAIIMEKLQEQPKQTNDTTQENGVGKAGDSGAANLALPVAPPPQTPVEQARQETPPKQPEDLSSGKAILWIAVVAFLAVIGGVAAWKRKR